VGVKIAVVGGGSTYTPELIEGFHTHRERLRPKTRGSSISQTQSES
jgi:alpha-galactosidase/6-phospho-beta-glucosidase family protein